VLSGFILLRLVSLSYQTLDPQEDRHHPYQADPLFGHHEDAERTEHAKGDQHRETELLAHGDVPAAENRARAGEEQHKDEEVVCVGRGEGQATRDYRFKYPAHSQKGYAVEDYIVPFYRAAESMPPRRPGCRGWAFSEIH